MLGPVQGRGSHRGRFQHRLAGGIVDSVGEDPIIGRPGWGAGKGLEVWKKPLHRRQGCVVGRGFRIATRNFPCRKWFLLWCTREEEIFTTHGKGKW